MGMEFEDGHSPAIFFCLFAILILTLFSRTERKEPNVCTAVFVFWSILILISYS